MTSLWNAGELLFGVRRVYIATYNPTANTHGTAIRVPSVKILEVKENTQNRDLEGDDGIQASSTRLISADITCQMGGVVPAVLDILNGGTSQSSGGANFYRRTHFSNRRFPYFSLCGKANDSEADADMHIFAPKCKVTDGYSLKFEFGEFSIPELHFRAVIDDNYLDETGSNSDVFYTVEHNFLLDVSIPPAFP